MIRETFKTNTGIMFDSEGLRRVGLDPSTLYPEVLPRPPAITIDSRSISNQPTLPSSWWTWLFSKTAADDSSTATSQQALFSSATSNGELGNGTEEEEDLKDALMPIYDQLVLAPGWWTLEVVPLQHRHQPHDCKWVRWYGCVSLPRFRSFYVPSLVLPYSVILLDGTLVRVAPFHGRRPMVSTCTGL